MQFANTLGKPIDITSDQLKEYRAAHHENEYVLVDVRQPEEYEQGHIPGARLFPLPELDNHSQELRAVAERTIVFYCRSGARSARACTWAVDTLELPKVANLLGGFLGFRGVALPDFPRLRAFAGVKGTTGLLGRAFELEKATYQLYRQISTQYAGGPMVAAISGLADAELAHGKAIHAMLKALAPSPVGEFQEMFSQLPEPSLVESGESFAAVAARARELGEQGAAAILELAAEIEFSAYDLYKNLAEVTAEAEAKQAFLNLAQEEKEHAALVLRALGKSGTGH